MGGLSAAHELVERGFDVEVYEAREIFGGKARSFPVEKDEVEGLPAEHGFRFLPGFYRHLRDTMERIPVEGGETVRDNLVETKEVLRGEADGDNTQHPLDPPETPLKMIQRLNEFYWREHIPSREHDFFLNRYHYIMTCCEERWEAELENTSWWEFTHADEMSEAYRKHLVRGLTKILVAMDAEKSSARTIGKILKQMSLNALDDEHNIEILNAPTNEAWIEPWSTYLEEQGAELHEDEAVESIDYRDGRIQSVETTESTVEADHYVLATPIEVAIELVTDEMKEDAPSLVEMRELHTDWMNGIQYYLDRDVELVEGHGMYLDSPWALTTISQNQFWSREVSSYGDGDVEGIISVCISDWDTPGVEVEKPASDCTREEIRDEVWTQLKRHLNEDEAVLKDEHLKGYHLSPGITREDGETTNAEPLLINTVGSRQHRPPADTEISNLYLASDYVLTETDLATMEGANEAARNAVNGILKRSSHTAEEAETWGLRDPTVLKPLKFHDRQRYRLGLPHVAETTGKLWKKRLSLTERLQAD